MFGGVEVEGGGQMDVQIEFLLYFLQDIVPYQNRCPKGSFIPIHERSRPDVSILISFIWQFQTGTQLVELKFGKDPSSLCKDAVDGLFQLSLSTLNYENEKTCVPMTKYTHLTFTDWCTNCWAKISEGSFKCRQGCSWWAVPAFSKGP